MRFRVGAVTDGVHGTDPAASHERARAPLRARLPRRAQRPKPRPRPRPRASRSRSTGSRSSAPAGRRSREFGYFDADAAPAIAALTRGLRRRADRIDGPPRRIILESDSVDSRVVRFRVARSDAPTRSTRTTRTSACASPCAESNGISIRTSRWRARRECRLQRSSRSRTATGSTRERGTEIPIFLLEAAARSRRRRVRTTEPAGALGDRLEHVARRRRHRHSAAPAANFGAVEGRVRRGLRRGGRRGGFKGSSSVDWSPWQPSRSISSVTARCSIPRAFSTGDSPATVSRNSASEMAQAAADDLAGRGIRTGRRAVSPRRCSARRSRPSRSPPPSASTRQLDDRDHRAREPLRGQAHARR